jgi:hypothetical protein
MPETVTRAREIFMSTTHCEGCRCSEKALAEQALEAEKAVKLKLESGDSFTDGELVYAATARCLCGAGMAYPKGIGTRGFWDCSAILKGEAIAEGKTGSVKHEGRMPFTFYEVKSENQPSVKGMSTRPKVA